ncbi:MAG: terminase [Burkholderiaceae bacterium]
MAPPPKWKDEYLRIAAHACRLGATDADVADMFHVSVRTLQYWKADKPGLVEAMRVAKDEADARVERSLYERAIGYEHPEIDIRVVGGQIVQTEIRKHYPPDTTAAIFWLKNRQPRRWRDRTTTEHTGEGGGPIRVYEVPI